jgi:hypothetical protein
MKTLDGVGASASDVPLRKLPDLRRRMRATGIDDIGLTLSDVREAIPRLRRLASSNGDIRLTFPCHVTISLHSGGVLETDGRERGGSGHPLEEQQQVVDEKFAAVREVAEIPKAWRRRPSPAGSSA